MFEDVVHGMIGTPWYGDDQIIDRWWPDAVRLWQEALAARAAGRPRLGPRDPEYATAIEEAVEEAAVEAVLS
jgi:hypothetical protein